MRGMILAAATLAAALALGGCKTQHEVAVTTPEPVTVNLNIRLQLDEEVTALLREELETRRKMAEGASSGKLAAKSAGPAAIAVEPLAYALARVEALKERGLAAEADDGYVRLLAEPAASAGDQRAIHVVNVDRSAQYQALAGEKGVAVAVVEQVAGQRRQLAEPTDRILIRGGVQSDA